MKGFLLSILASIVAGLVLYWAPAMNKYFESDNSYITVEGRYENFGDQRLSILRITNQSRFAIDPLIINRIVDGETTFIGLNGSTENKSYKIFPEGRLEILLPSREAVDVKIISNKDTSSSDLTKAILGKYSYLDEKGIVQKSAIKVITASEKQFDQVIYFAKWLGVLFLVFVLTMALIFKEKIILLFKKHNNAN